MDFLRIFRSLEQALYEVMTWLVFFPRTLWRALRHPLKMMEYSIEEQSDKAEEQYADALSPPIFLILCIVVAHGMELLAHTTIKTSSAALNNVYNSQEVLLSVRIFAFAIYPLMYAIAGMRLSGDSLDRIRLRAPFFSQCYVAGPFALLVSGSTLLFRNHNLEVKALAAVCLTAGVTWYISAQAAWFRRTSSVGQARAIAVALRTFLKALIIVVLGAVAGVLAIAGSLPEVKESSVRIDAERDHRDHIYPQNRQDYSQG